MTAVYTDLHIPFVIAFLAFVVLFVVAHSREGRSMTPLAGAATDTGLLREHNEDRYWMDAARGALPGGGWRGRAGRRRDSRPRPPWKPSAKPCRWAGASAEERVRRPSPRPTTAFSAAPSRTESIAAWPAC